MSENNLFENPLQKYDGHEIWADDSEWRFKKGTHQLSILAPGWFSAYDLDKVVTAEALRELPAPRTTVDRTQLESDDENYMTADQWRMVQDAAEQYQNESEWD